jgi:hypothetical protein
MGSRQSAAPRRRSKQSASGSPTWLLLARSGDVRARFEVTPFTQIQPRRQGLGPFRYRTRGATPQQDWPWDCFHPHPAAKFALDAEDQLPLHASERPKQKRRIDGRSGDEGDAPVAAFVAAESVART